MAHKKLVKDDNVNKELLGAIVHYLLEEDHIKQSRRGNELIIKVELQGPLNNTFEIDGLIGNADYIVTSLKFFDTKTTIEKERGQWVQSRKPKKSEIAKGNGDQELDEPV